ncbi:uncharacterized protein LOC124114563 isoform X1 [Haliotis rufescens]|uniref:uncharacterized protein LOC124114563 isoform X1 n=2 Tax=Haliotis rufescens TaxID=6454 RepID=UPI00201FB325|nr:uncharacterized protein LOC124114563 isoform X1 [Haliotis rufescens]
MPRRLDARGSSGGSKLLVYLQCYFVTIATILGTGILGLPVTLTQAGMYPFLISFITSTLMQVLLIFYFTDLLQRAIAVQRNPNQDELVPLQDMEEDSDDEIFSKGRTQVSGGVTRGAVVAGESGGDNSVRPPNLHLLGELFLCCGVRQAFDVMVILQFIALLICYSLAGSEAFAQLVGISHVYVIPGFVWILTVAVVFALKLIQPVVSILTFLKGSLLLGTTIVTFYVGVSVGREISNDFKYLGEPFLMGTVALGGIINTMPFIYEKIEFNPKQIKRYRLSVLMGLITCSLLNILWCWAVLDIVPQTVAMACVRSQPDVMETVQSTQSTTGPVMEHVSEVCTGDLSLESAAKNGEISTLPLTKILQRDYPHFKWVAFLVELFIVISITVSYLTIGTALHHTLSGWVESSWTKDSFSRFIPKFRDPDTCSCINGRWLCTVITSILAFVVVFTVAMLDPQGFVEILEKFASFTLNAQAGIFVFLMLLRCRNKENRNLDLALPLPEWLCYLQFLLPLYFGFAVVYDVYSTIYGWVGDHGVSTATLLNLTSTTTSTTSVTDTSYNYTTPQTPS